MDSTSRSTGSRMKPSKKKSRKKRKPCAPLATPQSAAPDGGAEPTAKEEATEVAAEDEEAKAIDWLADAFSSASLDQIASAHREAGGDAYKAAGILGADLVDPGECPRGSPRAVDKKKFNNRKPRKVAASTGMVSDVIGKGYSSPKPAPNCGEFGRKGWAQDGKGSGKLPYNIDEAEQFLCSMLGDSCGLHMAVVRDVLCQCGYDVEKALDALIGISDTSNNQFVERSSSNYRNTGINYSSSCPDLSSNEPPKYIRRKFELTEKILDQTYHPPEKEHESLHSVGYVCRDYTNILAGSLEQPPSRSGLAKPDLQQKILERLFNIPNTPKYEPNCMNWKKVVEKVESFGQGLEFRIASNAETLQNDRNGKEDIYHAFRSAANKHWDSMKAYYQRAAIAYARGERAHASYLSEQGKHFGNLAREADEKASREIFEARNKDIKNAVTIDLHGQHVKQAIGLLKLHLLLFTYIPSIHFLRVITGCGSDGVGKGKLKRSVIGLVEKEGIEWSEENSGSLVLQVEGMKEYSFTECQSDPE